MGFKLGTKSRQRLQGVDERLVKVLELALSKYTKIDFGIPQFGGLRTAEEQRILFDDGKSNADGVTHKSRHQTGKAADVFAYVDGKASWDEYHLTHIATAIFAAANELGVKIKWGGHWKSFIDMPHYEVV